MDLKLIGGCRCGATRYEISAVADAGYCHCNQCRKRSGAPVFAFVVVEAGCFRLVEGCLRPEPSETTGMRQYCDACGSEIYLAYRNAALGEVLAIGIGSLDEPHRVRPTFHQCMSTKLPWLEIADDLPRFASNEISHPNKRKKPIP